MYNAVMYLQEFYRIRHTICQHFQHCALLLKCAEIINKNKTAISAVINLLSLQNVIKLIVHKSTQHLCHIYATQAKVNM